MSLEIIKIVPWELKVKITSFDRLYQEIKSLKRMFLNNSLKRSNFDITLIKRWVRNLKSTVMVSFIYDSQFFWQKFVWVVNIPLIYLSHIYLLSIQTHSDILNLSYNLNWSLFTIFNLKKYFNIHLFFSHYVEAALKSHLALSINQKRFCHLQTISRVINVEFFLITKLIFKLIKVIKI